MRVFKLFSQREKTFCSPNHSIELVIKESIFWEVLSNARANEISMFRSKVAFRYSPIHLY